MTPAPPAVSIIVPAWGVAHLVDQTLASLQAQSFTDWEAIVVDDGAPDDVEGAVRPFVAADPRIRFLATPHGGLAAARNHALAAARAPLIGLLDGDDLYLPDYLAKMVPRVEGDRGLGFVTCDARFIGQASREGKLFSAYQPQDGEPALAAVLERRFNVFIASLIRREAIEQAGGFDETLPAAEDFDLWLRLLGSGWRAGYVAEPLALYRRRPGSLSSSTAKLCRATARAYAKAEAALAGRPEAAMAAAEGARVAQQGDWVEGEDLVIAGRVRDGLAQLRRTRADRRSARWRVMMPLFRALPPLARPLLSLRRRIELEV